MVSRVDNAGPHWRRMHHQVTGMAAAFDQQGQSCYIFGSLNQTNVVNRKWTLQS